MGARVLWPPECSDDILSSAIKKTHDIIASKDVTKDGEKVLFFFILFLMITFIYFL